MEMTHTIMEFPSPIFITLCLFNSIIFLWPIHYSWKMCNNNIFFFSVKGDYIIVEYVPSPQVGLHQVGFHYSRFASIRGQSQNTNDTFILWAPIDELNDFRFIHNYGITIMDLIHDYCKINRSLVQGPINIVAVPSVINGYEIGSWNLLTNG